MNETLVRFFSLKIQDITDFLDTLFCFILIKFKILIMYDFVENTLNFLFC